VILLLWSCKKNFDAEPTYAKVGGLAANWAKTQSFYSPGPQVYIDSIATWRSFISFAFTSDAEPDKLGFANPYVAGKGTNALYMNTLYASQGLTSDSGYYNVTIPKCFQLVPKSADSTGVGTVKVLEQKVTLYRKDKSSFDIIIKPTTNPGTYNISTGLIEVEVMFDETSIGGKANLVRKYRFNS